MAKRHAHISIIDYKNQIKDYKVSFEMNSRSVGLTKKMTRPILRHLMKTGKTVIRLSRHVKLWVFHTGFLKAHIRYE